MWAVRDVTHSFHLISHFPVYSLPFYSLASKPSDTATQPQQQDVFSRIDANKLNTAIGNASMLGKMEVHIMYTNHFLAAETMPPIVSHYSGQFHLLFFQQGYH